MILINGRGQVGETLKADKRFDKIDCVVYHTWNFENKTERIQKAEFEKYKEWLRKWNKSKRLYYISTKSENNSFYEGYKKLGETLTKNNGGYVIKLPNLIGKGVCVGLYNETIKPCGIIEILSLRLMLDILYENKLFEQKKDIIINGVKIDAVLLQDIIIWSKKNDKND